MATLYSVSNYSNLSVISVIISVDCLYFIQIVAFLALGTISGFRLKPGQFRHYVLKLWILFKPSTLSSFLWHYSVRQGKGERHYFISLLTGRDRNLVSPLDIHKHCGRSGGGRKWLLTLQLPARPSLTPLCRGIGSLHCDKSETLGSLFGFCLCWWFKVFSVVGVEWFLSKSLLFG